MGKNKKILFGLWGAVILIAIFFVYTYIQLPTASNSKSKIVHVSFDDVYLCLKDLKDTLRYTSIFQHPFFESLKELHDDYAKEYDGNGYVDTLMEKVRKLRAVGKLDENNRDVD